MRAACQRVLIVEDNEDDYVLVRDMLMDIAAQDIEIEWVNSYEAAQAAFAHGQYDVCLLDHHLGGHTGLELLQELPASNPVPVILLTGSDDYRIDVAATKAGASDYLLKDRIDPPLLERSIRYALHRKENEAALIQAQRFAQATVDALPANIAVLDEDGTIVTVNAAWKAFDDADGFIGAMCEIGTNYLTTCQSLNTSETHAISDGIRSVLSGEHELFCREYSFHSENKKNWYAMRASKFAGPGSVQIVISHENISDRKIAEEELHKSEQEQRKLAVRLTREKTRLDEAQAVAKLGSWEIDFLTGVLTLSNETYRILDIEPGVSNLSYEAFLQRIHPDDRELVHNAYTNSVANHTTYSLAHRIQTQDGTIRTVHERCQTFYDDLGKPMRSIGSVQDITEQKEREAAQEIRTKEIVTIWESMSDAFFSVDTQWTFTHVNSQAAALWHTDIDELIGKNIWEAFPDSVNTTFYKEYHRAVEEQTLVNFEAYYSPDNAWREAHAYPSSLGLSVYFRDITERKQAETLLYESQQRLTLATKSAHIGIWDWDIVANKLVWDEQMYAIYGINKSDFSGAYDVWQNDLHPEDREWADAEMKAALAGSKEFHPLFRIVWPNGKIRHIEAHALVQRAKNGSPLHVIGVNRDVTESSLASSQLQFQKALLEAQTEASPDGILIVSGDQKILSYNQRYVQMWGVPQSIIHGDSAMRETIMDQVVDPQRISARVAHLYEHRDELSNEEIHLKDGRIFDRHSAPIKDANGAYHGRVWYFRDITERKRAENALRASEERFLSIVTNVPGTVYQFVLNPDDSIEIPFINEGCRELYECEPEYLKDNPSFFVDSIHPDDRAINARMMAESAENLSSWTWEGRLKLPSGNLKWVQGASRPRRLPNGGTLWDGLLLDITARKEAEEERDRFFSMSLDMLCIADSHGYFKRVNPAFSEILGFTPAELLSQPFINFVHPDDLKSTQAVSIATVQGTMLTSFENRYRTKHGSWRWLEWKSVTAPSGLIYAAARDITQRKESEESLRGMRDELEIRVQERTLELEQSNAALQTQIIEREDAEAQARTRARQQEAVAELGRRALTDIDIDTLLTGATALVTATLDIELSAILELMPLENKLRIRAQTGWKNDVTDHVISSARDSQAGYALLSDTPLVVSDLKEETRFKPSTVLLREDINSGITVIVHGYERPFGTLGAHTTQHRHFTQNDVHFLQSMSNVLAGALEQRRIETEIRQLNEQLKETNEQLRLENIDRQMALGALREVTVIYKQAKDEAEKARENAEVANRAKSEFLSRMSHELRTPLNAILGFGQILEMRNDEADLQQQDNIQQILKAGRHLLGLINEVLDIARIEAGYLSLSIEPVDVGWIVREVLDSVRPLAADSDIELVNKTLDSMGTLHILADHQRLKQVMLNLLSNAVKYNKCGGNVTVQCEKTARLSIIEEDIHHSGFLRVQILDTGPGLTSEDMNRLFVPFERLGADRSKIEGTGIGLSLCKRLVEAMNGRIGVESVVGQGSTFWIELPLAEDSISDTLLNSPSALEASVMLMPNPPVFNSSRTVLYVEDNISNVNLIERVILGCSQQIQLLAAMQGSLSLELATRHLPDLILLDVHLPDMPGEQVLIKLKANPATQAIPVVVLSADATNRQIERMMSLGAIDYLTKPLDIKKFLSVVTEILQSASNDKG